ncbi:hypothetical protein AAZX31_08G049000 [Glycine max]
MDLLYMNNLDASILVLRKLYGERKEYFVKHPTLDFFEGNSQVSRASVKSYKDLSAGLQEIIWKA